MIKERANCYELVGADGIILRFTKDDEYIVSRIEGGEEVARDYSEEIAEAKAELAQLDAHLPRVLEDLFESGAIPVGKLNEYNRGRLARRAALRAELATLQGEYDENSN